MLNYYVSYSRKRVSSVPRRSALGFVISMSAAIGMSEADYQPRLTLSLEIDAPFLSNLSFRKSESVLSSNSPIVRLAPSPPP